MAGLVAARVLADAYAQVTVIDRDQLPEASTHRRGVPHGRHVHALMPAGQQALEELFPGLTAELVAHGAPVGDLLAHGRWYLSGHRLGQAPTGLVTLSPSRPFLEGRVRARVRAHPNVTLLDCWDIVGLATTPDGRRVTGARVLGRADGSPQERVGADLVVDASGRGSPTPSWLQALGYARPPTEQVRIGLGYATRIYRLPPDALQGDLGVVQAATPQDPRSGVLALLEGNRWMLTLAGILGDHPPTDPDGFLQRLHRPAPCRRRPRPPSGRRLRPGRRPGRTTQTLLQPGIALRVLRGSAQGAAGTRSPSTIGTPSSTS